jgi:hypothetical protein
MKNIPASSVLVSLGIILAMLASGCGLNRQLMPLAGEDDKALEVSAANRWYQEKTAATMAFEDFAKAIREDDAQGCISRLGPMTLALLNGMATQAGVSSTQYWKTGDTSRIVLPGTGKSVTMLRNRATVAEIGKFSPTRREVTLLANIEGAGESRIKASFNGDGWVFEFIDSMPQAPAAPPAPGM